MSLFNELKRRNVIRVSMAYLAGAWLILQVADTVIPWLGLEDSVGRVLLVVLLVGFIPTVIATWLFEWTPEGIRFDDEVEVDAAGAVVARRRLDRIIIGILAVAVVYFAVDEFVFDVGQVSTTPGNRSIVVLPFEDNSPDGDQAYLANGIADELRLELQHLEGLRVAGQTSSNAYAQEDLKTIGEILDVESVLEGGVRKDGDNVRITVRLTNAADGFTIWSNSYSRKLDRIFEMQEEIATSVAGNLGVRLGVGGVNAFHGAGTQNVEAYEAYLRAKVDDWSESHSDDAITLLERAIALDPGYAVAHAMLALKTLNTSWDVSVDQIHELVERAHQLAFEAVRLDPESAAAHSALAIVQMTQFDWIGSEQSNVRAIELLADHTNLERYALMLMRSGRTSEAVKQISNAMTVEPLGGNPPGFAWHASMAQGRIDEARERRNRTLGSDNVEDNLDIALNIDDPDSVKALIQALPRNSPWYINLYRPLLSEFDSPDRVLSLLRSLYRDRSLQWPRKRHDIALAAAYFGDPRFALEVKAEEVRLSPLRLGAVWYPVMSQARQLPEFKELVRELNLVEYWRAYGWADYCRPLGEDDFECQ